ncbi:MAG: hypothetical protein AUJ37_04320 [Candidatus Magasanikbacteria bacterium CG1_02_41_34]|uniref:Uncharacterized protein n=1 Tax=Candidatus Magasanikbacteria bacterium CG_4_10_14_0_2_um_filter_41_31 TaxID=1974639 RepID=A0A2M7V4U9_9BACT|nr:MAG: hypothetical protein AUJ37_04320 [Candidatus Magasanikbacteria bacterium CG1_02_41_34]PIZ93592.1 MAG: hypothetical protein COX83_01470 [Candidatus Magasanikbacteria bacterium CG_4_10_14_0_2_um_filter_41_31]
MESHILQLPSFLFLTRITFFCYGTVYSSIPIPKKQMKRTDIYTKSIAYDHSIKQDNCQVST